MRPAQHAAVGQDSCCNTRSHGQENSVVHVFSCSGPCFAQDAAYPVRIDRYDRIAVAHLLDFLPQRVVLPSGNVGAPNRSPILIRNARHADTHSIDNVPQSFGLAQHVGDELLNQTAYFVSLPVFQFPFVLVDDFRMFGENTPLELCSAQVQAYYCHSRIVYLFFV